MKHKLVCVDIEASNATPMSGTMLSFGACIVYDRENNFYRELKPDNKEFNEEAMRVGCKGLECLKEVKHQAIYDSEHSRFQPELALYRLQLHGQHPLNVMKEFSEWVYKSTEGYKPVLIADPAAFDAMWIHCYFDKYHIENPFKYGGKDLNSLYEGATGRIFTDVSHSKFWPKRELPHHGLEDALITAEAVENVLNEIKKKRK